jgi:hypothetical protein
MARTYDIAGRKSVERLQSLRFQQPERPSAEFSGSLERTEQALKPAVG